MFHTCNNISQFTPLWLYLESALIRSLPQIQATLESSSLGSGSHFKFQGDLPAVFRGVGQRSLET